jgi:hypothetical protein
MKIQRKKGVKMAAHNWRFGASGGDSAIQKKK